MIKNINLLLIAFYLLTLPVTVFASGLNLSSNHGAINHNAFSHHKSKYSTNSYEKQKLRFHRKWNHNTKSAKKIKFPYYIYYSHWSLFRRNNLEKEKNVELNINIINDKKDEQIEPTVNEARSFSPPHIMNFEDIAPKKSTKNLKTSNKQKNVILIYGTKIIETEISSD